jgi:hypothetical protein
MARRWIAAECASRRSSALVLMAACVLRVAGMGSRGTPLRPTGRAAIPVAMTEAAPLSCADAAARMADAMALLEADGGGWRLERYRTRAANGAQYTHFVLLNHRADDGGPRDVWLRFHGSGAAVLDEESGVYREMMNAFSQSVPWVLASGEPTTLYAFLTTETTAYGGYFHDLCQDEAHGLNIDYPLGDWGYALVGGKQARRHLHHLRAFGYVPGASLVTSVGYSDGGYLSSMLSLLGVAQHAVAWGGWVFAQLEEWAESLRAEWPAGRRPRGMRLELYISAGDSFYNGTSGWSHMGPPECDASMRGGLGEIANLLELVPIGTDKLHVAGAPFLRTLYSNADDDNVIACHVDVDPAHDHQWLFSQEAILRATSRVSQLPSHALSTRVGR